MPRPETTIEKMVRAFVVSSCEGSPLAWDETPPKQRARMCAHMRAALAVLREPTEAMLEPIIQDSYLYGERGLRDSDGARETCRAVIDAILAEHLNDRPADAA